MSDKPKPGGYFWRQDIARIRQANQKIRRAVRRILEENPGPQATAALLTQIALQVGFSDESLRDLEEIVRNKDR